MEGQEHQRTFEVAQRVVELAAARGIDLALIGAMALAAHHYVRATVDLDLASAVDPVSALEGLAQALRVEGFDAQLHLSDAQDSLGRVVNDFSPWNGLAPVGREAAATAIPMRTGRRFTRSADGLV